MFPLVGTTFVNKSVNHEVSLCAVSRFVEWSNLVTRGKRFTIAGPWHVLTSWCSRASRCGTQGSSSKTPDTDIFSISGRIFAAFDYYFSSFVHGESCFFVNACIRTIALAYVRLAANRIICHKPNVECVLFAVKMIVRGKIDILVSIIS